MTGTGAAQFDELPGLVRRGVGWMMASQAAIQVMALLTSVVVARLLSPRQVGLASEGAVFVSLALVVGEFGFAAVIIQRPSLAELEISTLFWAGLGLGLLLTLLGVAVSPLVADLYGEHQVEPLFAVMSLTFLATAPGIVQGALLTRELRFRKLELRTIVATVSSCAVAIVLAVLGAGPWAIVAQMLTVSSVSTVLLWRSSTWRPGMMFSVPALRRFAGFTSHVLGSEFVVWANANVDNLLVGRFLGASPLGAYSLAFAVALTPVNRIALPLTQVFFPAFSRIREPARIAEVWLRATRILAFVAVPMMLGLIVVAPDLVSAVFGAKWRHAAPVMQLLAGIGLIQTMTTVNDGVLKALDRTRTLFRFRSILSVLTLVAFAAGLPWGITGATVGYLIASVVLQPVYVWLTLGAVGARPSQWLRSVLPVLLLGGAMLAVLLAVRHVFLSAGVPAGIRLAALILIGAIVYLGAVVALVPAIVNELRSVRRTPVQ